jgi:hypothetical protein
MRTTKHNKQKKKRTQAEEKNKKTQNPPHGPLGFPDAALVLLGRRIGGKAI